MIVFLLIVIIVILLGLAPFVIDCCAAAGILLAKHPFVAFVLGVIVLILVLAAMGV